VGMDDIPLFGMLKSRLGYLNQRERVISQNVANADVAGYTPKDVRTPDFAQLLSGQAGASAGGGLQMLTAIPGHMPLGGGVQVGGSGDGAGDYHSVDAPDSETRMNGNSVVLEEQMLKMAESRMAYDAAISFYQQSLNMLRLAARKPGG